MQASRIIAPEVSRPRPAAPRGPAAKVMVPEALYEDCDPPLDPPLTVDELVRQIMHCFRPLAC